MKYIINHSNDPAYNLALEAYAFLELTEIDEIFLLWINEPTIVIGRHQNAIEEINKAYIEENHIHVVRRLSGGGAVYHDLNNLNYTIISSHTGEETFDFKTFSEPVIETLEKLGVKAEFTGRNDLVIDGKKFCGNAQAFAKGRMMHHGCLLFNVDLGVLSKALKVSSDKIESKGIKSVRSRVTNILNELPEKMDVLEFRDLLFQNMLEKNPDMTEYVLNEEELEKVKELRDTKFGTWEWTYGATPEYTITREKRYVAGKITTFANVEKSVIKNIKICGDFFGIKEVSDVEKALIGCKYEYQSVLTKLRELTVHDYFAKISVEEVAKAIAE